MSQPRCGPRPRSRIGRLTSAATCAALMLGGLWACDPCSGVIGCSRSGDNPYLAVDGQVVDPVSGVGMDGVRVEIVRRSGIDVDPNTVSTVTANGGHWRAEFTPTANGFIDADVAITTPAGLSYTVTGIRLTTTVNGGDANVLDRWVNRLYFDNAGEIYVRGSPDTRVVGAAIEFHRTGGADLVGSGATGGVVRSATDFAGRVPLFSIDDGDVYTNSLGSIIGDLIVRRSATDSSVIKNLSFSSSYVYRAPTAIIRLGVGPSLAYDAMFVDRATGFPVEGVPVSFERTSGIDLAVSTFNAVSNASGRFRFSLQALSVGVVHGRLIYRAPLAAAPETLLVALPTFDSDSVRFYGKIGVASPKM